MARKISLFLAFMTLFGFAAFAQNNDTYVSVLITHDANRNDSFRFFFSPRGSFSLDRRLHFSNWHIPLAHLSNHMYDNGYSFIQMQFHAIEDIMVVIFRRN